MSPGQAPINGNLHRPDLSHMRVTNGHSGSSVPAMSKAWPVAEFQAYLRACMGAAGISDFAELSRRTGVGQWQFSTWKQGKNQPSAASLRRIAPALDVPAIKLFLAAGVNDADELDLSDQPDLTVLPAEIKDFIALYLDERLTDDQRRYARQTVAYIASGLRAELAKSRDSGQVKPSGRRRAG
jgi:transcriptional regulator with XRE-family HTH domain